MERDRGVIFHDVLGEYEQRVFDTPEEAGHIPLASSGKYGWQMPVDTATSYALKGTHGSRVMDLGSGLGETVAIPALKQGADYVLAVDVTPDHLDYESLLARYARHNSMDHRLSRLLVDENWWNLPMSSMGFMVYLTNLQNQPMNLT